MKQILTILLVITLAPASLRAQSCLGTELKVGSGYEMISYDGKGKESGRMVYKILKVSQAAGNTVVDLELQMFDKKDKETMKSTYQMKCTGDELKIDASSFMAEDQRKSLESFEMTFTSNDIIFPGSLSVGQKLKDGSLHGEGSAGPMSITTDMKIMNRIVEGKEKLSVPAGTFDVFKITSDMNVSTKTVMKIGFDFQSVSYRAKDILWDIKTETYRKGKLMGTTVLSKLL
jgi:hypothetical protein